MRGASPRAALGGDLRDGFPHRLDATQPQLRIGARRPLVGIDHLGRAGSGSIRDPRLGFSERQAHREERCPKIMRPDGETRLVRLEQLRPGHASEREVSPKVLGSRELVELRRRRARGTGPLSYPLLSDKSLQKRDQGQWCEGLSAW